MKIKIAIIVMITSLMSFIQASDNEACKDDVRKSYGLIATDRFDHQKKSLFMHYHTLVEGWYQEDVPTSSSDVSLWVNKQQIRLVTKDASFYSDNKDVFIVVHRTGNLIRQKPLVQKNQNFYVEQATLLKDSLIIKSSVVSCNVSKDTKGRSIRWTVLAPPKQTQEYQHVRQIRFGIDVNTHLMTQLEIHYSKRSPVKKIVNTYHEIKPNGASKISGSVSSLFFDKHGKIRPEYSKYEYQDHTK